MDDILIRRAIILAIGFGVWGVTTAIGVRLATPMVGPSVRLGWSLIWLGELVLLAALMLWVSSGFQQTWGWWL